MAENGFIKELRYVVERCCSEKEGIVIKGGRIGKFKISAKAEETLRELLELVMETEYFQKDVRCFLKGQSIRNISSSKGEKMETTKSRIYYQIGKLKKELGQDALAELLDDSNEEAASRHGKKIRKLKKQWEDKGFLDNMAIRIPAYNGEEVTELDEDVKEDMYEIIRGYRKETVQIMERLFTEEMVSYVHSLERQGRAGLLTGEKKEEFEMLKSLLGR